MISTSRKMTAPAGLNHSSSRKSLSKHHEMDFYKMYAAMEKGHKICKLNVLKKWDPVQKMIALKQETRLLVMTKLEQGAVKSKPQVLDIRHIREVQTLDYKMNTIKIQDKWKRDKEIQTFDPKKILVISYGTGFTLSMWILLFESTEYCSTWSQGLHNLMIDTRDRDSSCHTIRIERFLMRQFEELKSPLTDLVARKMMKPFVQTSLQYKVQSRQLQDTTDDNMNLTQFARAAKNIIHLPELFASRFVDYSENGQVVSFPKFLDFLENGQGDDMAKNRARAIEFLRRYLHQDQSFNQDKIEPTLSVQEFCDFLFSRENSIWDPVNEKVIQDMTKPLSHYWIASSHNTYLTGDQFRSDSSLDSYSQALLMGCRCIELDCWDGSKKPNSNEVAEIVIYHGFTMTSKILLRDVLYTIRHYAFVNSEYPVILSIEDNCSVPAQRILAADLKEILGEYLLVSPINKDEKELPCPAQMKKKIIVKHKKLQVEDSEEQSTSSLSSKADEFEDNGMFSKDCNRRGMLHLKDAQSQEWKPHLFALTDDKLCYMLESCSEEVNEQNKDDTISMMGDEDRDEDSLLGYGIRPEEQHVTEEWFHGRCARNDAVQRLLQHKEKGNGLFMIRDSNIFIGEFSLSILHDGKVHHVRIGTKMIDREKKYFFMDNKMCDTLYELVSHYTRHYLTTPTFKMALIIPCPQPTPHVGQPWFSGTADKGKAEELLNKVNEDGAFLIRHSSSDSGVFVLSLRVDGEIWHYRLKRDGRIFVVNQAVFENLNQIVEYYGNKEFVRGISLRIPVNESNVDAFANGEAATEQAPGCYMDLRDLEKEIQAVAIRPYVGQTDDELTFPANARITVIKKEEGIWRGRYGSSIGWFPSSHVQEISTNEKMSSEESQNYNTIELAGMIIEPVDSDRQFSFRIAKTGSHWNRQEWIIACSSKEDRDDWLNQLSELKRSADQRMSSLRSKEKKGKIAAELSNLVVYCKAVSYDHALTSGAYNEMCSFVENKLDKLVDIGLVEFNTRLLSRVYPHGSRITSTNYNPVPMWNAGCHMVALNYQTGDKPMQLNQGKFLGNGQCGYILKPDYMLDPSYDPSRGREVANSTPIRIMLTVIGGRHLSRKDKNKGICSPFVEVEVIGVPGDDKSYRSNTISSNGLNPMWNFACQFDVYCPEVAVLRFHVEDGDFLGGGKSDPFIGQAVYPLDCIRSGYRSVPLKNQHSEELELSSLLVDVQIFTLENAHYVRSARSLLQEKRLAPVHRKVTGTESLISPTAPRQIAPRLGSLDNKTSIDSITLSPTTIAPFLEGRKGSTFKSQDSQDSYEGSTNGNGPPSAAGKKKKRSFFSNFF